jgi:hypothetical protein
MELPNEVELCEQVFLTQPKPHHIKYAEKHRVVENDMLKRQEFFEGCHALMCAAAYLPRSWRARRRPTKMIRPRNLVIGSRTNPPTALTIKTDTTKTYTVIGLTRGTIKMIASTIAIPHAKIARIATKTINLAMMTKVMPSLQKPRITRVATMPTMLKQAS